MRLRAYMMMRRPANLMAEPRVATVSGPDYPAWVPGLTDAEVAEIARQVNTGGDISAGFADRLSDELNIRPTQLLSEGPGGVEHYEPPLDLVLAINQAPPEEHHGTHRAPRPPIHGPELKDAAVATVEPRTDSTAPGRGMTGGSAGVGTRRI
jgi:hypothetical protein